MDNKSISIINKEKEILTSHKNSNKICFQKQHVNGKRKMFWRDGKQSRRIKKNIIFPIVDNQENSQRFLDSEKTRHEKIAKLRNERFKGIILNEDLDFSWTSLLSRTFGIIIAGFLMTTPLTLIPLHDMVEAPQFWYEILFTATFSMAVINANLAIFFGSLMNNEFFFRPQTIRNICISGSVFTIFFLLTSYLIWTHSLNYRYPIPLLGNVFIIFSRFFVFFFVWCLVSKKLSPNPMLLKRLGWVVLGVIIAISYGTLCQVIVSMIRKSSDEYQPIVALIFPAVREAHCWIASKMVPKGADGDQCGSSICLNYMSNVVYAIQLCIVLGSIATDITSWVLIGVDYSINIYLCLKIVWLKRKENSTLIQKQIDILQQLICCELVEFLVPFTFVLILFVTFNGPNAKLLGNIGSSYWHYAPIEDINLTVKNILILGLVDFSSTLVCGLILWCTCKINIWRAFNDIQKEFGKRFCLNLGSFFIWVCA